MHYQFRHRFFDKEYSQSLVNFSSFEDMYSEISDIYPGIPQKKDIKNNFHRFDDTLIISFSKSLIYYELEGGDFHFSIHPKVDDIIKLIPNAFEILDLEDNIYGECENGDDFVYYFDEEEKMFSFENLSDKMHYQVREYFFEEEEPDQTDSSDFQTYEDMDSVYRGKFPDFPSEESLKKGMNRFRDMLIICFPKVVIFYESDAKNDFHINIDPSMDEVVKFVTGQRYVSFDHGIISGYNEERNGYIYYYVDPQN